MTQAESILLHLRTGASLTPLEALERWGCARLAARIDDLRHAGHDIETTMVRRGRKAWAQYTLRRPQQCELFQEMRA
jgi:hypothetical protein